MNTLTFRFNLLLNKGYFILSSLEVNFKEVIDLVGEIENNVNVVFYSYLETGGIRFYLIDDDSDEDSVLPLLQKVLNSHFDDRNVIIEFDKSLVLED